MSRVTLIIPAYNCSDTIEMAVRSALDQTVETRVIVVDDCSTDNSFSIVEAIARTEPRLTVRRQSKNGGPSIARNTALRLVETPWVAGLDSDDFMLPDRMRKLLEHAESRDVDFVADDVVRVAPGSPIESGFRVWKDDPVGIVPVDLARFVRENTFKYVGSRREIGYLKPLMRVSFLRQHELFFREDMRGPEDYDFYQRCLYAGARFEIIDPCGYIAYDMPGSLSKTFSADAVRKIIEGDKALLSKPDVAPAARGAIREHVHQYQTELAWMQLILAKREKDVGEMISVLTRNPPDVSGVLVTRIAKHLLGLSTTSEEQVSGRKPIGSALGELR